MDLPQKGTRELTAEDFVYSIKRMANPRIIAPVYGTMVNYLPGLKDFAVQVRAEDKRLRADLKPSDRDLPFLDLRKFELKGVSAPDKYTPRARSQRKVPAVPQLAGHDVLCAGSVGGRSLLRPEGHGQKQLVFELLARGYRPLHAGGID